MRYKRLVDRIHAVIGDESTDDGEEAHKEEAGATTQGGSTGE